MNPIKGKLIVIEGTDGSGKETQSTLLMERLHKEGMPCGYFSFPVYDTPSGDIIKRYLGKPPYTEPQFGPPNLVNPKLASTWYALNRVEASPKINTILSRGVTGLCNRWRESNMSHQGGKIKDSKERYDFIGWLNDLENSLKVPKANLVAFLYMPHQVATALREERAAKIGEAARLDGHEGDAEHMLNAERTYLELADRFGWKRINCAPDGTRASLKTIEQISDEVYSIVKPVIQNA